MWFWIILAVDQLVKFMVEKTDAYVPIIKDVFNIEYVQNTGGIYGMMQGKNSLFAAISIVILVMILFYAYKDREKSKAKFILWQCVIAGGLSNVLDRVFRGYVVDFIQLKLFSIFDFGIFNLSDACIVLGVIAIILLELKEIVNESNRSKSDGK